MRIYVRPDYCQSSSGNKREQNRYCQGRSGLMVMYMRVRLEIYLRTHVDLVIISDTFDAMILLFFLIVAGKLR